MSLSRRASLQAAAASALLTGHRIEAQRPGTTVFGHGIASGDPLHDSVVIWTRVTPRSDPASTVRVRWQVTTDQPSAAPIRSGTVTTSAARDFTVKVDVRGLDAGRTYLYRFEALGESISGRTRTLPTASARVRLAVVSCSNYPAGFFNGYAALAARDDLDAVVHLGDYIYEFANGVFGDGTDIGRRPDPDHETVTLDDYRRRYASYRTDPDLQDIHRRYPFIAVWDDHEFADNAWLGGIGEWASRRAAAMRAYLEWMPVRERRGAETLSLYRSFTFANLATLAMLDTRSNRDGQVFATDDSALRDPRRRLIGSPQERWLGATLRASKQAGVTWSLVGQQVMFSPFTAPGLPIKNPDAWDGYQAQRARVRELLGVVGNSAVLTGDMHSSWAFDVPLDPWNGYRSDTGAGSIAVELITPAISSQPYFTGDQRQTLEPAIRGSLPHLKFLEGEHRGFMVLEVTAARLAASWFLTPDVRLRSSASSLAATFIVEAGSGRLTSG